MPAFEDEGALLGDLDAEMEEDEGEDLFGDNMEKCVLQFFFIFNEMMDNWAIHSQGFKFQYSLIFIFSDYRPMPHLDRYDDRILDEDEYEQMSVGDRLAAEEELRRRDREMGITRRDDRELFYDQSDDEEDPRAKRRRAEKVAAGEVEDTEMIESIENLEDTKGYSIKDWVVMMGPRTEIANRFKNFLRTYVNSKGQYVYKEKMRRMCENNQV